MSTAEHPKPFPEDVSLRSKPQIVVVGAGISGISTAYYLQKQGKDVVLVDSLEDVGLGATKVAVPILKRHQAPIINYDVYDKIKSNYCPVRMFYRAQKFADTVTHKAFYEAYGFDILNLAFDGPRLAQTTEKLAVLTQSNYSETLNLIAEEQLPIDIGQGHLLIGDDKTSMVSPLGDYRKFRVLFKDCDTFKLESDAATYLFPQLQQDSLDHYGGLYSPSSLIFHPTLFSQFLQGKMLLKNQQAQSSTTTPSTIATTLNKDGTPTTTADVPPGKVSFLFNTKAVGFSLTDDNQIASVILEHRELVSPQSPQDQPTNAAENDPQQQRQQPEQQPLIVQPFAQFSEPQKQYQTVSQSEIPVDKVILCNGYQAYQITETLVEQGPLLHIIPVRSLSFDVYDKTRARYEKQVPSFFPTYPTTFFPPDPEFDRVQEEWHAKRVELGLENEPIYPYGHTKHNPQQHPLLNPPKVEPMSVEEIEAKCTSEQPLNLNGITAIEFAHNGCTLVQDLHNPRHFHGYLGKDMAHLSDIITDRHMDSIMNVLESVRKIPVGALTETDQAADQLKRHVSDRSSRSSRYLSMQPATMGLHTVGRDGLPIIGPSAHVPNLYFNTGHGNMPQNTAIIGGKMISKMIADPFYGENVKEINRQFLFDQLSKEQKSQSELPPQAHQPKQFDLKRLFNIVPTRDLTKAEKLNTIADPVPVNTSSVSFSFRDFSPSRWALHKFTPFWFEEAITNEQHERMAKFEQLQKRELKRQQIAARLAERNARLAESQ